MPSNGSIALAARKRIIPAPFYNGHIKGRGRSSGVERNLAKVEVVSSNLIARSNFSLR